MKILILNRDYPAFLAEFYKGNPGLSEAPYLEQLNARNASLFGVADFYSHGLAGLGQEAQEIHVNNHWLQAAWARKYGLKIPLPAAVLSGNRILHSHLSVIKGIARRSLLGAARRFFPRQILSDELRVLAAQIEQFSPDVILNQEMSYIRFKALRRIVGSRTKIVGQIASALPVGENFKPYDLIVSSLPNFVQHFNSIGARASLNALAFDARILQRVPQPERRDVDVSFVGSISADHGRRMRLIETLARNVSVKIWGTGVEQLPRSSPIRSCFQGEAWGARMYAILSRSRITINQHIDLAEGYSNNMRLYEATGCGALMVVDRGRNLTDIFEPNREVIVYSSPEECVEVVREMLSNEAARAEIARAGQRRTLSEHTYARRTLELYSLLTRI